MHSLSIDPIHAAIFFAGAYNLTIALVVLFHHERRLVNCAFFIFAGGAAFWGASIALLFTTKNFFFNQFIFYSGVLLLAIGYQLAIALEKERLLEESERHARDLEKKVGDWTRKLRAMHELEQNMVCDISHGLQTPLAIIKGELEFLKRQMPKNKKLAVFERSIDDVSAFIRKLLSLARLDAGTNAVSRERVDLSALCRDLAEYFDVVARDKGIHFSSSEEGGLSVIGSREQLTECITNIVSNAMAYQKVSGERRVSMVLEEKHGSAILCIEDTGIGIAERDVPHIFERFRRVLPRNHTGARGARPDSGFAPVGTGLGLAIARRIAEGHGGTITVKSALGEGSTFTITLPLVRKNAKEEEE